MCPRHVTAMQNYATMMQSYKKILLLYLFLYYILQCVTQMKKQGLQQIYLLHLKLSEVINTILNLFFLRRFNSLP